MKITLGKKVLHWHKPHWVLTLLVVVLTPFLLSLSYWQWQRAHYKEEILRDYENSLSAQPVAFTGQDALPITEYQPMTIQGKFDTEHLFFLDNAIYEGRAGFEVLAPFQLKSGEWMLVNLGWMPRNPERQELPITPELPANKVILSGRADIPNNKYLLLGTYLEAVSEKELIIQAIDLDRLQGFLGHSFLPIILLADPEANSPYVRDWNPKAILLPATHYGYSMQWALLSMTLVILYIVYSTNSRPPGPR